MTQAGPITWRSGAGWLVLVGGARRARADWYELDAAVLGWSVPGRPIAALLAAGVEPAEAEDVLECWADLGGSSGYVVEISGPSDPRRGENCQLLSEAGLVYMAAGPSPLAMVRALGGSLELDALACAYEGGAPIIAADSAAAAMGAWVADPSGLRPDESGLGWVSSAVIAPQFTGAENAALLRRLLDTHHGCLGLGIPGDTALAFGPAGRIETHGSSQVTVVLRERQSQ